MRTGKAGRHARLLGTKHAAQKGGTGLCERMGGMAGAIRATVSVGAPCAKVNIQYVYPLAWGVRIGIVTRKAPP